MGSKHSYVNGIPGSQEISLPTRYVEGLFFEHSMRVETQEFIGYERGTNTCLETLGVRTLAPANCFRLRM